MRCISTVLMIADKFRRPASAMQNVSMRRKESRALFMFGEVIVCETLRQHSTSGLLTGIFKRTIDQENGDGAISPRPASKLVGQHHLLNLTSIPYFQTVEDTFLTRLDSAG